MSEHTPITGELRDAVEWTPTFCGPDKAMVPQPEFDALCDAIDAVHAGLERENAELRERVAKLDYRSESMHIGEATVAITPTLDWTGVARELRAIADTLAGDATWDSEHGYTVNADECRHHHAQTVEDVLRELLDEAEHFHSLEEERDAIAEYASKLRLVGDAE